MKIKINISEAQDIQASLYQARMSLIRALNNEEKLELKEFYNPKRIERIQNIISKYEDLDFSLEESKLNQLFSTLTNETEIYLDKTWIINSIGLLKTLLFYIKNIEVITEEVLSYFSLLCLEKVVALKTKNYPDEITYFARHGLEEESYMDKDYLWLNEIKTGK